MLILEKIREKTIPIGLDVNEIHQMYKKRRKRILMLDENYKQLKNKTTINNQLNIQKYLLDKEWKNHMCSLNQHIKNCLESV